MIYCTAPFTSILLDTDKTVKPCCAYGSGPDSDKDRWFGKLTNDSKSLSTILKSEERIEIQEQVLKGEIPSNCYGCEIRYKETGHALRLDDRYRVKDSDFPDGFLSKDWQKGITVLEVNSNNTCNLACSMCNSHFSTAWLKYEKQTTSSASYAEYVPHPKHSWIYASSDTEPISLVEQLKEIDLTFLTQIIFKGGEPFMNPDLLPCLQYFSEIGILSNLSVGFNTNGTILNKEIRSIKQLLSKANEVVFSISVDGVGDVQTYIRHSPKDFASIANIEKFIEFWDDLENLNLQMFTTISIYNIFSLDKIVKWWLGLRERYESSWRGEVLHTKFPPQQTFGLNHFVIEPKILSIHVLDQKTINELIQYYINKNNEYYKPVIAGLNAYDYLGDDMQLKMIDYTLDMDKIKGQDVFKAVPELKPIFERNGIKNG